MTAKPSTTLTPARRFVVRLVLATGATVSTILGAQTLAFLEHPTALPEQAANANPIPGVNSAALVVTPASNSSAAVSNLAPTTGNEDSTLAPAAPQMVIIRNPGVVTAAQGTSSSTSGAVAPSVSIQTGNNAAVIAPQPVLAPPAQSQSSIPAIQAPVPVIQQQPVVQPAPAQPAPRSRSSR